MVRRREFTVGLWQSQEWYKDLKSDDFPPWLQKNYQKDFVKSVDEPPDDIPVD